jgi:hypothetical protein
MGKVSILKDIFSKTYTILQVEFENSIAFLESQLYKKNLNDHF